jgi:hypothetical protein
LESVRKWLNREKAYFSMVDTDSMGGGVRIGEVDWGGEGEGEAIDTYTHRTTHFVKIVTNHN